MPGGSAHRQRTGGIAGRLAVGTASFIALAATFLGLPYVLIKVAGNPLPDHVPTPEEIWTALVSPDRGGLFLGALTLVAWIAWLTFALSVLVEIPAQLRGRRTIRLPGLGAQQRLAAVLIGAILAIVLSPAVSNASTMAHRSAAPAPVVASAMAAPEFQERTAQAGTSISPHVGSARHTVQLGESLLGVAEQYGVPYQTLAQANYDVVQPDGRSLEPGGHRVYPGWTLTVPGVAHGLAAPVAGAAQAQQQLVYEVVHGDWLGCIAERYLGDFDRYPEIANLNQRIISDPDHIEPAWQLTLPADAYDRGSQRHATGTVISPAAQESPSTPANGANPGQGQEQPSAPAQQPSPPVQEQAPPTQAAQQPAPVQTPAPAPTPTAAAPTPTPAATASATPAPSRSAPVAPPQGAPPGVNVGQGRGGDAADGADVVDAGQDTRTGAIALGAAGLLAALAFAALRLRRRAQHQHHQVGYRPANPMDGAIETDLRAAQQPYNVDRFDTALRYLAARLAERQEALPDPVGAIVSADHVRLLLAAACEDPPAPWQDDGDSWLLPGDAVITPESGQIAPFPAMAGVGAVDSTHLFLDLEKIGLLTLTGDPQRRASLLRYLASELALNAWSDDVNVILAGFTPREAQLLVSLNPDRVRSVGSITEAATRLSRRVTAATATLDNAGVRDALAGRVLDVAADAWMPQILLAAQPDGHDLDLLHDLVVEIQNGGRCAVGVVVSANPDAAQLGPWTISVDTDGMLRLPFPLPYSPLNAASLPMEDLERLAQIMRAARDHIETVVPPAPEPDEWARGTDAAGGILSLFEGLAEPTQELATLRYGEHDDLRDDTGRDQVYPMNSDLRDDRVHIDLADGIHDTVDSPDRATDERLGVAVAAEQRRRDVITAVVHSGRELDLHLEADLRAWWAADPTRPRIAILGSVEVEAPGPPPDQRRRFHAEIIVYLAQRAARGADRDQLEEALWPDRQVKDASRRVAITRARRWLGETSSGEPWLPDMGSDRSYRLQSGYLLDWHLFRRLRTRAAAGGASGMADLRAALELVRGVPLDGADQPFGAGSRNPYTWLAQSDIHPDHITVAIVDTAHELARLYLEAGDTIGVRWAVVHAWLADPGQTYDQPWRDMMSAQSQEGQSDQVRATFAELMRLRDAEVPEDLDPATFQLALRLLPELRRAETAHR